MIKIPTYIQLLVLVLFSFSKVNAQFNIPPKPQKVTDQVAVFDYADILDASEENALNNKLIRYADTTSTQIVIATISSLKGEDIGILTPKWAQKWGIGDTKKDNGVFILLSKNDRRIWISPGYGVEQYLTAGQAGEITRQIILPEFKKGSYYLGLQKGTSAIMQLLNGTFKGFPQRNKIDNNSDGFPFILIIIIAVLLISILSRKRNNDDNDHNSKGGKRRKGLSPLEAIILSNMGRGSYRSGGGFSGGGFSGGGFGGGFGGGGFSGGGAGGSW